MVKKKKKKKEMSTMDIAERIKNRLDGASDGGGFSGGGQLIKFDRGNNLVRLLPYDYKEAQVITVQFGSGRNKTFKSYYYEKGGIFDLIREFFEKYDKKRLETIKNATTWLWSVIDRNNPTDDDGNLVASVLLHKWQVFEGIGDLIEEYGQIMHPKKGRDINVFKKVKNGQTSYKVKKGSVKKPLTREERELEPVDLEELADRLWDKDDKTILKDLGIKRSDLEDMDEDDEREIRRKKKKRKKKRR